MSQGAIRTVGTRLYVAVSASEIVKIPCVTSINGLGAPANQIPLGCIEELNETFIRGRKIPETVSIGVVFIPRSAAHQALLDLDESGSDVSWMIVLSDQAGDPVSVDSDGRLVSPGATTFEFLGNLGDANFSFDGDEAVRGVLSVQRSGAITRTLPAADLA